MQHLRVALFGGSFNPPHIGHVKVVEHLLNCGEFDRVLIVPTYQHPFDKSLAPYSERIAMCQLAFQQGNVEISRIEESLSQPSFTFHTIEKLLFDHPDWKLYLVIGSDVLNDTDKWYRFDDIMRLSHIYIIGRKGYEQNGVIEINLPDISSTLVRGLISKNTPIDLELATKLVPESVFKYINERKLYGQL